MGILQKFSDALGLGGKEMNVQEYLDSEDLENLHDADEEAAAYVKPVALENVNVITEIKEELRNGNLILLNITPMLKNEKVLTQVIDKLKDYAKSIRGDIARIDNEKILLTPAKMKIVKRRK
ncbi:MAG: cell division protein SepF [Candidatus Micrarchaeota archaeon]|nr:cell division protein SepF [Candidatus Micrarchaeota archaeon]